MIKFYYVAYGSNLCNRAMKSRCKDAFPHDPYPNKATVIKDYKLMFRNGLATIEPCKGSEVPVGVWAISKNDEKALDSYEGFPHLYRKEYVPVSIAGYGDVKAMVYIMNGHDELESPSQYYENIIREGYANWNLDVSVLDKAIDEAKAAELKR